MIFPQGFSNFQNILSIEKFQSVLFFHSSFLSHSDAFEIFVEFQDRFETSTKSCKSKSSVK